MSSDYITKEIDAIINSKDHEYPLNIALASAWILANFKAYDIKILDLQNKSSLADYFIIASVTNGVQASSAADTIAVNLKRNNVKLQSREGEGECDWILLDCGDIIIHLFQSDARAFYDLDKLWKDSAEVQIPPHYYSSSSAAKVDAIRNDKKADDEDYF